MPLKTTSITINTLEAVEQLAVQQRWQAAEEMKRASQSIAKDGRACAAEREGFAPQIKNFVRQAKRERGREQGRGRECDDGLLSPA